MDSILITRGNMVLAFYHLNWILKSEIYAIRLPDFRRTVRDGPLEKLGWGGGDGGAKYKKNIRAREN